MAEESSKSVYEFTVKDIHGNDVNLSECSGKVVVIANVASKYLTQSNFKELSVSYGKYKNKYFEILAFPCNQLQDKSRETMRRFKAEFPLFEKIEVNGKNEVPLYRFLKGQKGGIFGSGIQWNFNKFLGNKEGKVVERYAPVTLPIKIEKDIDIQNLFESSSVSRTAGNVWFGIQKIKRVCR